MVVKMAVNLKDTKITYSHDFLQQLNTVVLQLNDMHFYEFYSISELYEIMTNKCSE